MGKLCVYLPPFASDYAGACSALFDLDCLIAINDAGCCTYHYAYIDEPRWNEKVRPIFCTTLRNTDAILGTDDKVISAISTVSDDIGQELTAVVGTPVPAIIGMDTDGIAAEIEFRTKRPAFGFNTTGFSYYDKGIAAVGRALIDRFANPERGPGNELSVNIVGMTPMDYGNTGNDHALIHLLEAAGIQIRCRFFTGITISQIECCAQADLNIAVSSAGMTISKYLKQTFGTPWIAGFPVGETYKAAFLAKVRAAIAGEPVQQSCKHTLEICEGVRHRILIVADQVLGNSLREELELLGEKRSIDVASFFGCHRELLRPEDISLKDEKQYILCLKSGRYDAVIGDPLLFNVPYVTSGSRTLSAFPVVHPAVSGKLKWNDMPLLSGSGFEDSLKKWLSEQGQ